MAEEKSEPMVISRPFHSTQRIKLQRAKAEQLLRTILELIRLYAPLGIGGETAGVSQAATILVVRDGEETMTINIHIPE